MVGGNFSYTNLVGGNTEIGSSTGTSIIQGNSTINYTGQLPNRNLTLQNLKSLGAASNHTIRNAGLVRIIGDTLTGTLVVDSFGTGGVTDFDRINITGTTQLIEGSYQNTITYLRRSRFNGPFTYQANSTSASAILYEAYQGGNTYIQNALFEFTAPATQYIAYENASSFMANLSIVRKGTGRVDVFTSGASTVLGHFSFTNPFGGITNIGNNTATTTIQGKVTIEIQPPTPTGATTSIIRLKNQTAGGIVRIIGGGLTSLQRDTLVVDSIIMRNLGGNGLHDHRNNHLTAHVHMSDAPMSNCSWYWVGSTVNGNAEFIKDGTSNIAYFAYLGNSYFGGHVHHKVNSGTFQLSYDSETYYMGNLLLENNAANSIIFGNHNTVFTGAANTSYEQLGSQLITIPRLRIDKANQARLTLQDSLVIGQQLQFEKGYIYTSPEAELWFANNAVAINARDSSHVVGPVSKTGSQAFSFPVGDGRFIQPIGISAPVLATDRFRAQYFTSTAPQDTAARAGTLAVVSGAQHWTLNQVTGTSNVVVTLEYGRPRGLAITAAQANLRVARWNGSLWADLGQAGATGNHTEGTINTTSATSAFGLFTLAATSTIDPLPNTTTIAAPGCANEARIIPFKTSGRFNPHNTFVAQLSNASGSFANPLTIGAIDLAPDGINQEHSLTAFIPSSALGNGSGSNYRIRGISTDAPHTGSTNPAPLSLNSLYIGPDTLARIACPGGTANLTGLYNLTGLSSSYSPNTPTAAAPGMV
ncbi:MAG TPA: hypothetical protein PKD90_10465, partial [Phnomibacter sp.]|nr:hypothetical protein [Phnomibacter sp.]